MSIQEAIKKNILILDGAMGTMLQRYNFSEEDFRGERFKDFPHPLKGNNDLLSLTQPQAIRDVHAAYYEPQLVWPIITWKIWFTNSTTNRLKLRDK
jgi:5-methyltetrahydrofolate--homocysteine methyltransferase